MPSSANEDSIDYYRKLIARLGLFNKNGEIQSNSDFDELVRHDHSTLTEKRWSSYIPALKRMEIEVQRSKSKQARLANDMNKTNEERIVEDCTFKPRLLTARSNSPPRTFD